MIWKMHLELCIYKVAEFEEIEEIVMNKLQI